MEWLAQLAGRFIVFDGPDGSGKSTQFARFGDAARAAGVEVCEVREPGGTAIGERVRSILLDPSHGEIGVACELLLYMASRAQLVHEVIRPALGRGELVLADRFISATLAYQGTAGGIDRADILRVGEVAIGETWPDLTVIFDVDETVAAGRLGADRDRMEAKGAAFHRRVRQGFLDQVQADPDHHLLIDAAASPDAVYAALIDGVETRLSARARS